MGNLSFNQASGWWIGAYRDQGGRRRKHRLSRNEKEAREALAALEGQAIVNRRLGIRPLVPIRFGDMVAKFVEHAKTNVPRSWKRYQDSAEALEAFFGKQVFLTAIEPEQIEKYKSSRLKEVKPGTINRDLQALRRMFNLGKAWSHARENPFDEQVSLLPEPGGRVRYLTQDEFVKVVSCCPPHLRPLIVTAVHTGLRMGDLLRLQWPYVDLENGFASILQPKNNEPRHIPLNRTVQEVLLPIKLKNKLWVFTNEAGKKIPSRTVEYQFALAIKKAGIQDFRFHDLRHTTASWLAMAGANQDVIRDVLGHKDIRMSFRYTHLMPGRTKAALEKLDKFFPSKSPDAPTPAPAAVEGGA